MKKVIHWDLFSGVGMFSYALDQVYGKENTKHIFVEWDAFCTQVLKKHWPEAEYHGDIGEFVAYARSKESRRVSGEQWQEMAKTGEGGGGAIANSKSRQSGKSSEQKGGKDTCRGNLKILTGGFPCQPFSAAGRRRGTRDNRYLWPEMFAVIRNIKPDWVIAENVRGLVTWNEGMVLETVCADMEGIGYEVQPLIIPACAVGAPHRRDRVWIIANDAKNAISKRTRRGYNGFAQGAGKRVESEIQTARPNSDAPN
ncbi:MAG: DNA (cytosine-5-)-methyltransferase, partial [Actinobacteria bacterium]|nr:DNA (cytosine-5-)-methyltransferase [Actinomycetota bacterium]